MSSLADQPAPDAAVAARVEELYERHSDVVRSVCRALLRDRVEEEDALQQTFLSAQRALLNGSCPSEPAAWLATIARHECYARVHARMREPLAAEREEHAAGPDAHAAAVRRHETGELRDALADLPAQQRAAILLREVRGLSYQEVASALSVTTAAVESLLFRARRTLQTRLKEARAGLSPAEWAQPVRELLVRLAGGGLAGPAAAKVAALGVGTAVVAGGALSGPTVLGLGHAPVPPVQTTQPAVRAAAPRHSPHAAPRVFALPRVAAARPPLREIVDRQTQHSSRAADAGSGERSKSTDGSGAGGSERPDDTSTVKSSGDGTSRAAPTGDSTDGTTQHATSSTSDDSQPDGSDSSTGAGGSQVGTTTTGSGSTDD